MQVHRNIGIDMDKKDPGPGRYNVTKQRLRPGRLQAPTLPNVAPSAPYMHDGSLKTLKEVVGYYTTTAGPGTAGLMRPSSRSD